MAIDKQLTRELLERLVSINSVNPSLVPGAPGEATAARFLCEFLREHGVAANLEEAAPGRPNVVARIGPDASRAGLLLVAHVDTVGAGDMPGPFTPRERDGRLYGRGALDIKSGVAAVCSTAISLAREGAKLTKPLLLGIVVDEECNSIGTQALVQRHSADAAVVLEPTDLKLCVAHKGYAWFEIVTQGRAAHGSLYDEGRDAIRYMGRVLNVLDALDRKFANMAPHALLGRASVHASLIEGGQELSSYPAECRLQIERRTLPGESDAQVEAELRGLLESLGQRDPEFHSTLRAIATRAPYEIERGAPIATATAAAMRKVTGVVEHCGMPFWTDTALLGAAGIPGVVFGPTGRGLHGREEYVELESVYVCAEVLRTLALNLCAG